MQPQPQPQPQPTLFDIAQQIAGVEKLARVGAKPILDLDEASVFTGFSKGHLYRLTSSRGIPHYKKGRKLLFKKAELEAWMCEERIRTDDETDSMAATYIATHR